MNELITEQVKAVLFDHDDTLVGTLGPKMLMHKLIAEEYYDKQLTDAELQLHWGKRFGEFLCRIYNTDDPVLAMSRVVAHRINYPKKLFPETVPTLRRLKLAGIFRGIITSGNNESVGYDLDTLGIPRELIDYFQTEEDTKHHKPKPEVFEPAIEWLLDQSITPDSNTVVYVGDGLHDMEAARDAGFSFIGVTTGLVSAEEFKDAGYPSVNNLAALIS